MLLGLSLVQIKEGGGLDTEIIVAIIGAGAVVYAATVGLLVKMVQKKDQEHKENLARAVSVAQRQAVEKERRLFHQQVTSPYYPVKDWTHFVSLVQGIHSTTQVDRVLILVAVNGSDDPSHASVVWELRSSGEQFSYTDVPLDADYVHRLLNLRRDGKIRFKTKDVPGTLIGRFYEIEGVTEAVWVLAGKRTSLTTSQVAYKYMSVATHDEGGFTDPKDIERQVDLLVANFRPMLPVSGFGPV